MASTSEIARVVCCAVVTLLCVESAANSQTPRLFGLGQAPEVPAAQAQRLAQIAPRSINRDSTGSVVSLSADEIERLDLKGVVTQSRDGELEVNESRLIAELVAAIDRMRVLTLRNHTPALMIEKASASSEDLVVRFNELLDGIPIESGGLIAADMTGRIRSYEFVMLTDDVSPGDRRLWLTEPQAVALAQKAIVSEHGGPVPSGGRAKPRYMRMADSRLNPEWMVEFDADARYFAVVDAITGTTRTFPTFIN